MQSMQCDSMQFFMRVRRKVGDQFFLSTRTICLIAVALFLLPCANCRQTGPAPPDDVGHSVNAFRTASLRQVGTATELPIDGDGFRKLDLCEVEKSTVEFTLVMNCFNDCTGAKGCPEGCCISYLGGAQVMICRAGGKCMRVLQSSTDALLAFGEFDSPSFGGRLTCPLAKLSVGSKSCATPVSQGFPGLSGLRCPSNKIFVRNVDQLESDGTLCVTSDDEDSPSRSDEPGGARSDDNDDDDDASEGGRPDCFPGDAVVRMEGGGLVHMAKLEVGDRVHVGGGVYSEVYMFSHRLADGVRHRFVKIGTSSGKQLRLSALHYLTASGKLREARSIRVGDVLTSEADLSHELVTSVASVLSEGLYNPHTLQGDIAVDGIVCSTFTGAFPYPWFAQNIALAPCRAAQGLSWISCGAWLEGTSGVGEALRAAWYQFSR